MEYLTNTNHSFYILRVFLSNMNQVLEDKVENRSRTVYIDCERYRFMGELVHDSAYVSHTHYGPNHTTIMLGTDNFLQSVDIMEAVHPQEEKSLEDYFSGTETEEKEKCTSVIIHPYIERPELSEETGRDYIQEMDSCIDYIKMVAKNV